MVDLKILTRKLTIVKEEGDEHIITFSIIELSLSEQSYCALNASVTRDFTVPIDCYSVSKYISELPSVLYADLPLYIYNHKDKLYLSTSGLTKTEC